MQQASRQTSSQAPSDRPPGAYWSIPALVSILRALPYVHTRFSNAAASGSVLEIGYNPQDWLAYLAMIRQVVDQGAFLFENPFTTEPQTGRFVLLFHWLIGAVSAATDLEPELVLELSRVPLLFGFFAALWWFTGALLPTRRERVWAAVLVGLGGGVELFLRPFAHELFGAGAEGFLAATWQLYGWSTFGAAYNPLWLCALTFLLFLLRPLLSDRALGSRRAALLGLGAFVLWCIHPYTAIANIAIGVCVAVARSLATRSAVALREIGLVGATFTLLTAPMILWQRADPAFRSASEAFFGTQLLSSLWYPLTFGALLVAAALGIRIWRRQERAALTGTLAWIAAVAVLHNSTIWNGYHYVMYLHVPVALLAAAEFAARAETFGRRLRRDAVTIALVVCTLGTPLLATEEALRAVRRREPHGREVAALIEHLARLEPGNVLGPATHAALIPAYTPHKVYAGHWFLTPDYERKARLIDRLLSEAPTTEELEILLDQQRIDYLIMPAARSSIREALRRRVRAEREFGDLLLVTLRSPGAHP